MNSLFAEGDLELMIFLLLLPKWGIAGMYHYARLKYLVFTFKLNAIEFVIKVGTRSHGFHVVFELEMKPRMVFSPDTPASAFQLQGLQAYLSYPWLSLPPRLPSLSPLPLS